MPQLTQSQGMALMSLTNEGYEGWRVKKHMMNALTPAGTPYHLGLKPNYIVRGGDPAFPPHEERRRKSLNIEMDMVGLTADEYRTVDDNADKLEALLIQKKTKNYTAHFQLKCKQKLQRESIQLLRH